MQMESDEDLYLRVQLGDLSGFDVLYERYQRALFRFIYSYLKNKEEAEEVFHETFVQVLKTSSLEFDEGSFSSWIYRVARNSSLNRLRSQKRGAQAFAVLGDEEPTASHEAEIVLKDFSEKVLSAAELLPGPLQEVFQLRRNGLAYKDISGTLGVPVGTVKSRLHTLVAFLKKELKI